MWLEIPVPFQLPDRLLFIFSCCEKERNSSEILLMSDTTVLWTLHTEASCFRTDSNCHDKRQYSQAMTVGQVNVLMQTQLCGVDELKCMSKTASMIDIGLIGDLCKTAVLFTTNTLSPQSYY